MSHPFSKNSYLNMSSRKLNPGSLSQDLRALSQSSDSLSYIQRCYRALASGNAIQQKIATLTIQRIHVLGISRLNLNAKNELLSLFLDCKTETHKTLSQNYLQSLDLPENASIVKLNLEFLDNQKISSGLISRFYNTEWSYTAFDCNGLNLSNVVTIALSSPASIFFIEHLNPLNIATAIAMKIIWGSLIVCVYEPDLHPPSQEIDVLPISVPSNTLNFLSEILTLRPLISADTLATIMPLFDIRILPLNKKGDSSRFVVSSQSCNESVYMYGHQDYTGAWLEQLIREFTSELIPKSLDYITNRTIYRSCISKTVAPSSLSTEFNNINSLEARTIRFPKMIDLLTRQNEISALTYPRTKQKADKKVLRVLIGTLYSGESELEQLKISLSRQRYPVAEHFIVRNLPNVKAHNTLYDYFLGSDYDIMIKLDADMVLTDPLFIERLAKACIWASGVAIIQSSILDYYSGGEIQGVNCYTKLFRWDSQQTDSIFTDRSTFKGLKRIVLWSTFIRSVIHCPSPHPFQAFHFGIHRSLKIRAACASKNYESSIEQLMYLEKLRTRYKYNVHSPALAYAYAGYLHGMSESISDKDIDYRSDVLRQIFEKLASLSFRELNEYIRKMETMERKEEDQFLRDFKSLARRLSSIRLNQIGLLIPHLLSFGGIFRFIEISVAFQARGILSHIIVPDEEFDEDGVSWINANYGELSIMRLSRAIELNWDVVICGDFSSGIMCHLPFFKTRIRCAYLLNGWQHRYINKRQIEAVTPEVIIANSSYCSDHYPDLLPVVVPGGINFNRVSLFKKDFHRDIDVSNDVVKVVCPSGRLKLRKRFSDALSALNILASKGFRIELHTFDVIEVQINESAHLRHIHHMGLARDTLFQLLSNMDLGLYPEEDAGWNNPVAEAACCCVPVVCTPAGTVDFISHELSGFVVPPQSPELIAEFAERLILDSDLRALFAKNAYKAIQSFDWQQTADKLISIFEETRHSKEPAYSSIGIKGVESLLREIAPVQSSRHADDQMET